MNDEQRANWMAAYESENQDFFYSALHVRFIAKNDALPCLFDLIGQVRKCIYHQCSQNNETLNNYSDNLILLRDELKKPAKM
jgi:hypothetical protein